MGQWRGQLRSQRAIEQHGSADVNSPRFAFGGSAYQNPYVPQQQHQPPATSSGHARARRRRAASGLLGGAIGQLQAGNVAGVFGAGAVPSTGPFASNAGFGTDPTQAGTTPQSWQNFQFQNPESDFQKNYNYLQSVDPELAAAYGTSPFHNQEYKAGIDTMQHGTAMNAEGNSWGDSMGNALINAYNSPSPGGNAITQSLGLGSNWQPKYSPQWLGTMFGADGKTITAGGKTYTLPTADKSYMPASGASSWSAQSPMDFSQFGLAPTR